MITSDPLLSAGPERTNVHIREAVSTMRDFDLHVIHDLAHGSFSSVLIHVLKGLIRTLDLSDGPACVHPTIECIPSVTYELSCKVYCTDRFRRTAVLSPQ
jgi:hypothetical protein